MPRSRTSVMGTSTCFVLNLTTVCRELLQKQCSNDARDEFYDMTAFSLEIARDTELKQERFRVWF